jgi:glutamyl-tRNA synthetase, bacterial family
MSSGPFVTRFAPSPTGLIHLGNARTALLNYLAARKSGGRFILRVEDTDEARSTEAHMHALFEDLHWLGLDWDEGPDVGGPHGIYRQQQRKAIYEEWLAKLDAAGLTYPCYCTPAELSISRKQQLAAGKPPRYAGTLPRLDRCSACGACCTRTCGGALSRSGRTNGDVHRSRARRAEVQYRRHRRFHHPPNRRQQRVFFSNAVDDALMGITLVLRGDDHMTNTPRQILLLQALSLPIPQYAHVALLLGMDGAPLSKRHGAMSLQDLRERGFLPGAVRNHLVRLGHTCVTDGWLDREAMLKDFDLKRLGRAAAKFDEAQLLHWQKEAVAHLTTEEFRAWTATQLPQGVDASRLDAFIEAVRRNVAFPTDVAQWSKVVFGSDVEIAPEALASIREAGSDFFATAKDVFARGGGEFKQIAREIGQACGKKGPSLFMPLRAALTGVTHGPELAPLLSLIAAEEIQRRLERAAHLAAA